MDPLYKYMAEDKDNELCYAQMGDISEAYKSRAHIQALETNWYKVRQEL